MLVGVLRADDPRIWVGMILVLVGIVTLPGATQSDGTKSAGSSILVAATMVGVGGYIILRDTGVIEVPVLGYGLSLFLIGTGIYGIVAALLVRPEVHKDA